MKHTTEELVEIVYSYFPRGLRGDEPHYKQTPEYRRRIEARNPASARFREWCAMLSRLKERLSDGLRDIGVQNGSPFLASPNAATLDRCFTGALWLPPRSPQESHHQLEFLVSFVVPYYFIHSSWMVRRAEPAGSRALEPKISFDFSPDEAVFVEALKEEIDLTFPGYELMPPDVGKRIIPDVIGGGNLYGESTIYGCLFSDNW